jgi:hypothetical protein
MLYNLSNTILTLQAYGYATSSAGAQGAKIILTGGNNGGGSISFTNDSTTTYVMNSSGIGINTTPGSYALLVNVNGDTFISGNIDCGGGIALTGSHAFNDITSVDPGNYSNTYSTLKANITNNDWCYSRQ